MNKRIKITFISLIAVSATLILGPAAFAQRDIGVGEVNVQRDVVPVVTRSQDGEALKILKTAFSIHGR